MPVIIAIAIYAVLFVSGTAISKNLPKSTPTPTSTTIESSAPSQIPTTPIPTVTDRTLYKVMKVIDGDTVNVEIEGKSNTLRLIGIDTPETVDPRKPVQCYGKEASDKARVLLTGKNVALETDATQGDKDKYDRLLRYVYLEDGTSVNKFMISEGYAHEYTYQSNPYKYQSEYIEAQKQARESKKGLWADNICITLTTPSYPTSTPKPISVPVVTTYPLQYVAPVIQVTTAPFNAGYACNCSKVCDAMASCDEAYFQLNQCGCSVRDGDHDGVPCESICN